MSDVLIRPARYDERSFLEALQWRASLANSGDRDSLLANPDAIAVPAEQITDGHVLVAQSDGVIVGFAAVLPRPDGNAELDALFVEPTSGSEGWGDCSSTLAPISRAGARRASCTSWATRTRKVLCRMRLPHDRSCRDAIRRRSRDAARALTGRQGDA
jgi:hypothetical protein